MGNLLFSPNGTINAAQFNKGAVILLAFNFFLWLSWYGGLGIGFIALLLVLASIYCWVCLFAKRFADAGKSGAWFLLIFTGFVIVSYLLSNVLIAIMSPEMIETAEELQRLQVEDPQNIEALMDGMGEMIKGMVIPYAIGYLISGAIFAFGTNKMLKSKQT